MIADLDQHWNALDPRTRQIVIVGGAIITVLMLYMMAWRPLEKDLDRLRVDVPRETEQLDWMRAQLPSIKTMRAKAVSTGGAVVSGIEQSAVTHGTRAFVSKIDGEGNSGARLTIDAIPFNKLVAWIADLQATQGLIIEEATIDAHATPGVVNARLRLRTGGA